MVRLIVICPVCGARADNMRPFPDWSTGSLHFNETFVCYHESQLRKIPRPVPKAAMYAETKSISPPMRGHV